ncbi:RNA-directed DNA polymerase (reverse transcriptase)-related family protein [Parasponia andersonii]|uniref:RNA-directed DNA polymerase (Reverse transcriptase)-related family protein n=1 Tax=Parasponia andersonii TaxID=3476 RepID=A0A2P5BHU5_PARAD|nr:RNA-directed DNA polymerase (reverse transcriptase)-related family protein [Parasponia andersonii]
MIVKFWWKEEDNGRRIHWIAWHDLCKPKKEGGLGFRALSPFNQAMVAKQAWRLIRFPNSLVTKVLKGKYFRNSHVLDGIAGPSCSYVWRSIVWSLELVRKGTRWRIGNGQSIHAFHDPWLPHPFSFKPIGWLSSVAQDWYLAHFIVNSQ